MEGFLQSLDSPCLHAPQRSCLKLRREYGDNGSQTVESVLPE